MQKPMPSRLTESWKKLKTRFAGDRNLRATALVVAIVANVLAFQNCANFTSGTSARRTSSSSLNAAATPYVATPDPFGSPDPTPIPTPVVKCNPPRKYTFTLSKPSTEPEHLRCTGITSLGSFPINDAGHAIARVNAAVSNTSAGGSGSNNGFDANKKYVQPQMVRLEVHVGQKIHTPQSGGDFCPGSWNTAVHGYGLLTQGARVDVIAYHDNIEPTKPYCLEGTTKVTGTVEVWVEDPRAECKGKDIVVASTTQTHAATSYTWRTGTPETLLTVLPTVPYDRTKVTFTAHADVTGNTGNGLAMGCNGIFINPGIVGVFNNGASGTDPIVVGIPNALTFASLSNGRGRSLLAVSKTEPTDAYGSNAKAELLAAIGEQKPTYTGAAPAGSTARYGDAFLGLIFEK
jgi:hypothetical protein